MPGLPAPAGRVRRRSSRATPASARCRAAAGRRCTLTTCSTARGAELTRSQGQPLVRPLATRPRPLLARRALPPPGRNAQVVERTLGLRAPARPITPLPASIARRGRVALQSAGPRPRTAFQIATTAVPTHTVSILWCPFMMTWSHGQRNSAPQAGPARHAGGLQVALRGGAHSQLSAGTTLRPGVPER